MFSRFILLLFSSAALFAADILPDHYIVELTSRDHTAARNHLLRHNAEILDSFHRVSNSMVVRMPAARAAALGATPGVRRVTPVRLYEKLLDHSLPLQKVPQAWDKIGGLDRAGLGVRIGIIDTGIDSTHPAFQDDSLPFPDGFPKASVDSDLAFTNHKIIVARSYRYQGRASPAKDIDGHGTGVAMAAAGYTNNGSFGPITGIAAKAYLGSYKVFPDNSSGAPTSLIMRALEDAVSDGMNVVNLSLGSFPAVNPADDPLVTAVEAAAAAGVVVVIAAGNSGPDLNTIGSPATAPSALAVGSTRNDRYFASTLVGPDGSPRPAVVSDSVSSQQAPIAAPMRDITALDPTGLGCGDLPAGSLAGAVVLILRGTCTFEVKINTASGAGAVAVVVYTDAARPDPITMSTGTATLPAMMVGYSDGLALRDAIAQNATQAASLDFSQRSYAVDAGVISDFSSRGPSADLALKPELVGVGTNVYTAKPGGWVVESGTSFSSPQISGAAAVLMGARPGLTAAQYKSLLVSSASSFAGDTFNQSGGGLLNLAAALDAPLAASTPTLSFGGATGDFSLSRTITFTNAGAAADAFTLSVTPSTGSLAPLISTSTLNLNPGQSQDVVISFSGTAPDPGAYQGLLQVQGSRGATTRIPYWYGVPSPQPAFVQILNSPRPVVAGGQITIYFRFLDASGIPVPADATQISTDSGAQVVSIVPAESYGAGAYRAVITAGTQPGSSLFHVQLGSVSKDVTVTIRP